MDFGSEYILNEEEEEAEATSSQHSPFAARKNEEHYEDYSGLECEFMEFNDDENVKEKTVNTNAVKMEMKKLKENPDVIVEKSKLVMCQDCGAAYSHLATSDADKKVWMCNFCNSKNDIKDELPDLSDKTDVMYVEDISEPPELKPPESRNLKIIFVIDTSTSMSVTTRMEVNKASSTLQRIILRDSMLLRQQQQQFLMPGDDPGQSQISDYFEVSRLQAIKASVINVIERLSKSDQRDIRVGLVTFHENVDVYGDGSREVVVVQGGQLAHKEELQMIGQNNNDLRPLFESVNDLTKKIESLEDCGRTALGPALVIAQRMTSFAPGSKVILCTDGVANIGLGKLDETTNQEIEDFYSDVIANSITLGVAVTIICVDNAGLDTRLGQVPTETGGSLDKIHATELEQKLNEELIRETVGLNADIKFVVHKDLYVNDAKEPQSKQNQYHVKIGNLQLDNQMSFSFAFKPSNPSQSSEGQPPSQASGNVETNPDDQLLPFQVQVKYMNISGDPVTRVWTAERKITRSRAQAESAMNLKTVVDSFIQESSTKFVEEFYSKRNVVGPANEFLDSGHVYLRKLGNHDRVTHLKLSDFIALMTKIVRTRKVTEEQLVELNKLKDARLGQVQG